MIILKLALKSLRARSLTIGLTILAIALSVALYLGVEKIRQSARSSFTNTISGTDLIMGARSGPVQLLLYSIFHIGNATNNISWQSYKDVEARKEIDWIVPVSLGDSHKSFRVMGTTQAFFDHYKYRRKQSLEFDKGTRFEDLFDTVIGADVAQALGYQLNDPIIVSHGIASFTHHDDLPFKISGILAKTGTPLDRTIIVSLEGLEAIHVDWQSGAKKAGPATPENIIRQMDLTPKAVTAALVGVKSKLKVFHLQRSINTFKREPLLAILPGVALQEVWQITGVAETALKGISIMVVITALIGMMAMIFSSLNERRREMAIFRAVGAGPLLIIGLLLLEAGIIAICGTLIGLALIYSGLWIAQPLIDQAYGLWLPLQWPSMGEIGVMLIVICAALIVSLIPAFRAYRMSLADGMMVRI